MTLFGSDAPAIDLVTFPRLAYARRFNGGQLADLSDVPSQVRPHVSMNTGGRPLNPKTVETWLTKWADREGDFTIDHEVNRGDKGSPTQFRADMRVAASLLAGTSWRLVEIFGQWQMSHKPGGGWADWHSPYAQAGGVDAYVTANLTRLPGNVADWLAPAIAYWNTTQLPGMICEWGFTPASDPTGGIDGARFTRQLGRLSKDLRLDACSAWNNPKSGPANVPAGAYVLTGAPLVAWQTVVEVG